MVTMYYRVAMAVVVTTAILLVGATGFAAADPEVATSGDCDKPDDSGQNGGGGQVKVGTESQDLAGPTELESIARGAVWAISNGSDCDPNKDDDGNASNGNEADDYAEVHVDGGQDNTEHDEAQVCIDNESNNKMQSPVLLGEDSDHDDPDPADDGPEERDCEYNHHEQN